MVQMESFTISNLTKDTISHEDSYMSCVMRKPVFGVSYQVQHKRAVQPQKMARGLKFQIQEVEGVSVLSM